MFGLPSERVSAPPGGYVLLDGNGNQVTTTPQGTQVTLVTDDAHTPLLSFSIDDQVDLSNVVVAVSADKALVHFPAANDKAGIIGNVTLYVPAIADNNSVVVCPNAASLDEVRVDCANAILLTVDAPAGGGYTWVNTDRTGSTPFHITCAIGSFGTGGQSLTTVLVTPPPPTYTVGGSVSGLSGTLVLQNNAGDDLSVSANGAFEFSTSIADGSSYDVTILTQPSGQTCTLANSDGMIDGGDIIDVAITCQSFYVVGGSVSGLSGTLVLQNNAGDDLSVSANGAFEFTTSIADESSYEVTILTQPSGQTCTLGNDQGMIDGSNVTTVAIACQSFYVVGGSVSGLSGTLVLQNNAGDDLSVSANGAFEFSISIADGLSYDVTILTQPSGQTCTLSNNQGTINGGTISNVSVTCHSPHVVGGSLSGLANTRSVSITLNGSETKTLSNNGVFTFGQQLLAGNQYTITVTTQPDDGKYCVVTQSSTTMPDSDVTDVTVVCKPVYVYFSNRSASSSSSDLYTKCTIGAAGALGSCSNFSIPSGPTAGVSAMAFNNGYVYIASDQAGVGYLTTCSVGSDGSFSGCSKCATSGVDSLCNYAQPESQYTSNAAGPKAIFTYGGYVYVFNEMHSIQNILNDESDYIKCTIGIAGALTACVKGKGTPDKFTWPLGMMVSGSYAYISAFYGSANGYFRCSIATDGMLTDCHETDFPTRVAGGARFPATITMYNQFVYTSDASDGNPAYSGFTRCVLDSQYNLTSCTSQVPSSPGAMTNPYGMAVHNGYAYFANSNPANPHGSYTTCPVDATDGIVAASCTTTTLSNLYGARSVSIYY